ncbi:MAG TPA: LysM peptidoglycan-binding domain-containing protein, partial [Anaerolineae bacterium]|nr:LysM peptidoglycan-binding domain-containing protein [Anaerolineae bacterium]
MSTAWPTPHQRQPQAKPASRPALQSLPRGLAALALACLILAVIATTAWAAPGPPLRHVVQPGDTLAAIAQQHGSTVEAILAANALADPDRIDVGQVLAAPAANSPLLRVEAQPRDTVASVARRFGVQPADVQAINELVPGQRLAPGQDLLVPAAPQQPSPALPPGPLRNITITPDVVRQGETVSVRIEVDASQPVSLSLTLGPQTALLRQARDGATVGLMAVHALTEPGYAWLDLTWQPADESESQTIRWPIPVVEAGYPTFDIVLPPDKGDLLAPDLVQAELERMTALWSAQPTPPLWRRLFLRPVADEFVTSAPYGQRRSYNSGPVSGFHAGQDFAAPEGAPVVAP